MAKCKSCAKKAKVTGVKDIPVTEVATAIASAYAMQVVDKAVTVDENGNLKDNYFAQNPTMKNAAYLALGLWLMTMKGEMYQGAGMGVTVAASGNLINSFMEKDTTTGIYGKFPVIVPQHITGTSSTAYGITPNTINGSMQQTKYKIPNGYKQAIAQEKLFSNTKPQGNPLFARAF